MHGLGVVILRYFNVYGPRAGNSDYAGVVSVFMRNILRGQPPLVHGSGLQTRCFTYVRDAVEATMRAAENPEAIGESINVGSSTETTILELAEMIIELSGNSSLRPMKVPHEQAYGLSYEDIPRRVPSTVKLEKILGFKASTSLHDGLAETIALSKGHAIKLEA
jgi:UDP-glucose 4-epimerase